MPHASTEIHVGHSHGAAVCRGAARIFPCQNWTRRVAGTRHRAREGCWGDWLAQLLRAAFPGRKVTAVAKPHLLHGMKSHSINEQAGKVALPAGQHPGSTADEPAHQVTPSTLARDDPIVSPIALRTRVAKSHESPEIDVSLKAELHWRRGFADAPPIGAAARRPATILQGAAMHGKSIIILRQRRQALAVHHNAPAGVSENIITRAKERRASTAAMKRGRVIDDRVWCRVVFMWSSKPRRCTKNDLARTLDNTAT